MSVTFSIAIPVHNGETFLAATLASAVNQKRPADEIVVVDDASTDRSAQILRSPEWMGKVHYVFNETPTGFADAWNRAAALSRSDFVTILHQDDLLVPEYLLLVEQALTAFPVCRHLYTGYVYIDEQNRRTGESPEPHSRIPKVVPGGEYAHRYLAGVVQNRHIHRCPGVTTSRALLVEMCPYRKEAGLIADDDFFLRVGEYTDVIEISDPLASFRQHRGSATAKVESLSHRLVRDYIYQTQFHRGRASILSEADICLLQDQAIRFINSYLAEALLKNDAVALDEARKLRSEYDGIVPAYFRNHSSLAAGALWRVVDTNRHGSFILNAISAALRIFMRLKKAIAGR